MTKGWFAFTKGNSYESLDGFYKNPSYDAQEAKPLKDRSQAKDRFGSLEIPTPESFFTVLTTDSILVLTSRDNLLTNTFEIIDLSQMDPIEGPEKNIPITEWKGGFEMLGNEFAEGSCIRLQSKSKFYVFCSKEISDFSLFSQ
jgi:hypothetical protein